MVRKTPRKERAPSDYGNIGQKGRRTGVTLEDTGVRDEHGMEPIPSFSSPQKLDAVIEDGLQQETHAGTYTADDSMEMAQSTIIEPLEVVRSVKNARRSIPRSVSPRKNLINGSPRRSVGLLSSPSKNINNGSPSRSFLHQPPNRQLDFSMGPPLSNGGISPARTLLRPNATALSSKKGKNKRPFDLTGLDSGDETALNDENAEVTMNGLTDFDDPIPDGDDASIGQLNDFDDDQDMGADHIEESIEQDDSHIEGESGALIDPEPLEEEPIEEEMTPVVKKTRGKPGRKAPVAQMFDPDESQISASARGTGRKGKEGRSKAARTEVYEDPDSDSAAKPTRGRGKGAGKKAPKDRDPNARPIPAAKAAPKAPSSRAGSAGPGKGRSYMVQRSETPMTDSGAVVTRSGRASFKPLAAWRGEKIIYGQRLAWNTPAPVTDIIRTDEVQMPAPPRRKVVRRQARARSELEEIEEEPEDLEPWETETGIMHAQVMRWDQELGKYDDNDPEEAEVAYAADAIEMRDIAGADFKFAKTLTLPFFGSGMVHLPPKGVKRVKNSRKMQMVFFVHQGRVTVDVGTPTTTFSIGKGGQWQVPRGNFYSISNESDSRDARIFFAQGCEWAGEVAEESVNQ